MRDFSNVNWREPLCGFDPWKNAPEDCGFYPKIAASWCRFFEEKIILPRGDGFANKPMVLMDWQIRFVGWLFGWIHRADRRRRFDTAFVYIPKKNGKSAFTSALDCALFVADGESDKKIYCAASTKEQAGLVFSDAVAMARHILPEKDLKGIRDLSRKKVQYLPTHSLLTAISCDAGSAEGIEPSAAVVDELHVMDNPDLVNVLRKGMITRRQPLMIYLTTAAAQGDNLCNQELDIARRVRDGELNIPTYFPVIFEATDKDDWKSEEVWKRVNPGYGVTIRPERFRQEFELALQNPRAELEFKRLNLNLQGKGNENWLDLADWDACPDDVKLEELDGLPCTMGLDLSSSRDITALVLYFPDKKAVLPFFFVPQMTMRQRDDYMIWKKQGLIREMQGACLDDEEVRALIRELAGYWDDEKQQRVSGRFQVNAIAYDPWRMTVLANKLKEEDLLNVVPFRQGFVTMAEPTATFERMVLSRELRHLKNPVLRWMASNAKAKIDPKGNTQVVKDDKSSPRKIDGLIAAIMALGVSTRPEVQKLFEPIQEIIEI